MSNTFNINNLTVKNGEKFQGFIKVDDTNVEFPVTIINGEKDGKTILITAGIHGSEYPCIKTGIELGCEIEAKDVKGTIIIIHPVNVGGFKSRVSAIVPDDNKNLNRVFPGDKEGTVSDKIAYFITNELQSRADFYFDMHGGDIHEAMYPYVYYPGIGNEEVVKKSREVAETLNVEFMVKSGATTGSYNSCAINGTPSILIERGGAGLCKRHEVDAYKKDMINALSFLEVLDKDYVKNSKSPVEITNVKYIDSSSDGCLEMFVEAGEKVKKGSKLYSITDFFGNVIEEYYAEFNCVILYNTVSLSIPKDASIIAYGEIDIK